MTTKDILDAIQSPDSTPADFAALPLPESYRAITVHKDETEMFAGMQQLAYRVSDVEEVSRVLRERGVRTLYDEPRRGTAGSRINFLHPKDTGGVLVELVEPASGH